MKRIAPGYYRATVETTLDGVPVTGIAEVTNTEDRKWWYVTLESDGRMFMDGDDWFVTKARAVLSLNAACKNGFYHYPGLGICVRPGPE